MRGLEFSSGVADMVIEAGQRVQYTTRMWAFGYQKASGFSQGWFP